MAVEPSVSPPLLNENSHPNTTMPSENLNMEELTDERCKAIEESIHTISLDELKALGEEMFPYLDHPWHETFFNFITENAGSTFHYATTRDHVHIIYCHDKDQGMWFIPGKGRGPLQEKGLRALKTIVEGKK